MIENYTYHSCARSFGLLLEILQGLLFSDMAANNIQDGSCFIYLDTWIFVKNQLFPLPHFPPATPQASC